MQNDNQEPEIFVFTDEDGNDVNVQVLSYFYYNGKEYAVMTELTEDQPDDSDDAEVFFMEVVPIEGDDENVEFAAVEDDDLADKLFEIISTNYDEDDAEDEE
jgi:uncharacterized protein YrzB (UPF0473 family)